MYCVYFIVDPRDWRVFYVGFSGNFKWRMKGHLDHPQHESGERIKEILAAKQRPLFVRVEDFDTAANGLNGETFWIKQLRACGTELLNHAGQRKKKERLAEAEKLDTAGLENHGKRWKKTDRAVVLAAYEGGKDIGKLADRLGRTEEAVWDELATAIGLPQGHAGSKRNKGKRWNERDSEKAVKWYVKGIAIEAIALNLGRNTKGVWRHLARRGYRWMPDV